MRLLIDAVAVYLALGLALLTAPVPVGSGTFWLALAFPLMTLAMLRARQGPDQRLHGSALDTVAHVFGVVSVSAVVTVALGSIVGGTLPVGVALRLWLYACAFLCVARLALLSVRNRAMRDHALATPTLIVGAGTIGKQLVKRLVGDPLYGLRPVGFLDANPMHRDSGTNGSVVPVLGGLDELPRAVTETGARHVILAFSSEPDHVLVDKVEECERLGLGVSLVPRLFESINERATLDHVGGLPLVSLRPTNPRSWQFAVKHALDRWIALVALLALAPLMLAIAIAVRRSSPGPVLFRQRRVGRDGHTFKLLKFRTMDVADHTEEFVPLPGCAPGGVEGRDRRTKLGCWLRDLSLDELPQLINVLRGDMSLVGPRPERPEFVEQFALEVRRYQDRHRVKSGVTGWAQVHGLRGQTSIDDRVEWDNYYVQNWSLGLDLRILAMTSAEILRFRHDG
jgi:exopolysaccharide biosynthesis polyprenyl glycosylphosphotransferase